jgi:hypothetical protein
MGEAPGVISVLVPAAAANRGRGVGGRVMPRRPEARETGTGSCRAREREKAAPAQQIMKEAAAAIVSGGRCIFANAILDIIESSASELLSF